MKIRCETPKEAWQHWAMANTHLFLGSEFLYYIKNQIFDKAHDRGYFKVISFGRGDLELPTQFRLRNVFEQSQTWKRRKFSWCRITKPVIGQIRLHILELGFNALNFDTMLLTKKKFAL